MPFSSTPILVVRTDCVYCYTQDELRDVRAGDIVVHANFHQRLDQALAALSPQTVYLGMNGDPYQPVERNERRTRSALERFIRQGLSACVLTKSPLILRDRDLFTAMREPYVGFSIAFLDEGVREILEPAAPPVAERLEALLTLQAAGIDTYALICPVLPYLTDVEELIAELATLVSRIWVYPLRMRAPTVPSWQSLRQALARGFPELLERYEELAFSPQAPYWKELRGRLEKLRPEGVSLTLVL